MTVLILSRVPPGIRGELTRWMTEVAAGTFVGRPSALVRNLLWDRIHEQVIDEGGSATLIWRTNSAQGFDVRTANPKGHYAEAFDGVWLVRRP